MVSQWFPKKNARLIFDTSPLQFLLLELPLICAKFIYFQNTFPTAFSSSVIEKLTKGWDILTAKIPLTYTLNAQQISICTRTLDKFIFSRTHVGTLDLRWDILSIEKLTKGWDILTAKIPLTYTLNAQQISTCTRTLDKFVFSRTHVGTPRLEMGHLIEKLTKGWDILTAKIPLTYTLNAQQISTCTRTLNRFVFSRTHVGTPRLEMGHLIEKLTKGWDILTAKIPLTYTLNAQ